MSLIDQKLGLEVCKDEAKESLQKRKDYYAKTDAQEQEYLKAERRKNATNPGAKLPKKKIGQRRRWKNTGILPGRPGTK